MVINEHDLVKVGQGVVRPQGWNLELKDQEECPVEIMD